MNKRKRRFGCLLPILAVVLIALFTKSDWIGRMIYPISYVEEIKREAERRELDPLLVASIIRVESNFRANAVSRKGALGIMQVMPETASWILKQDDFGGWSVDDVGRDAEAGIALGTWYLKEMLRTSDGNLPVALASYNAGPGNVRKWLREGTWDGTDEQLKQIPFGETRHYVQRVLYYYKKYQDIYEKL